jgi:hypothetical protein
MEKERFHELSRTAYRAAMGREVGLVVALKQGFEREQIIGHAAFRRGDDGGVPAHDVVAAEQQPALRQGEAEVIGRVPRRVHGFDLPVAAVNPASRLQPLRGKKIPPDGLSAMALADFGGTEAAGDCAGQRLQLVDPGDVVGMAVGQEDMAYPFAVARQLPQQGLAMGVIVRPRIDDGDLAASDDIGVGSLECQRSRVVGHEPAQAGRRLPRLAVCEFEMRVEGWLRFHFNSTSCAAIRGRRYCLRGVRRRDWSAAPLPVALTLL